MFEFKRQPPNDPHEMCSTQLITSSSPISIESCSNLPRHGDNYYGDSALSVQSSFSLVRAQMPSPNETRREIIDPNSNNLQDFFITMLILFSAGEGLFFSFLPIRLVSFASISFISPKVAQIQSPFRLQLHGTLYSVRTSINHQTTTTDDVVEARPLCL